MKKVLYSLLVLLFFCSLSVRAQEAVSQEEEKPLGPMHFGLDLGSGVYDLHNNRWNLRGLTIVGGTAMGTALMFAFGDDVIDSSISETIGKEWVEGVTKVGELLPLVVTTGFYGSAFIFEEGSAKRKYTLHTAVQLTETLIYTYLATIGLKAAIGRQRPEAEEKNSFPSGHTSLAFASAGILANRYSWPVGMISYSIASAIGVSRISLGRHFASDVVAGAGIGLFFATGVHYYHRGLNRDGETKTEKSSAKLFQPYVDMNTYGFVFSSTY